MNIPKNGDSGGRGDSTIKVAFSGGQWDPGACCRERGQQAREIPFSSALPWGDPNLEHWAQCWALQLQADCELLGERYGGCRAVRVVGESIGEI